MKTIGYIRVSTLQQAEHGISLEAQKSKIKAYCELKDMELIDIICDAGKSGSKANREGYQTIIEKCRKNEINSIVVYSLSRFTRSTKDLLEFVDSYVIKKGITLHSLSESLDTSTPTGRFMLKVMGAMNELEREQIAERTKSALQHKKSKGEKTGGDIPFGYNLNNDGKTLIQNTDEQTIIRQIESLKDNGYSNNAIAQELNQKGYKTKLGGKWTHVQVGRIIRRRTKKTVA